MPNHKCLTMLPYLTKAEDATFTALLNELVDEQYLTTEQIDEEMTKYVKKQCPMSYRNYRLATADAKGRVELELEELNDKITKCAAFNKSEKFKTLNADMQLLLEEQLDHMQHYAEYLKDRLEVWDK